MYYVAFDVYSLLKSSSSCVLSCTALHHRESYEYSKSVQLWWKHETELRIGVLKQSSFVTRFKIAILMYYTFFVHKLLKLYRWVSKK